MKNSIHSEAQRAEWLLYVVQYTAEELGMSVLDTTLQVMIKGCDFKCVQ